MSTNEQFAKACDSLEGGNGDRFWVIYKHDRERSPCINAKQDDIFGRVVHDTTYTICDEEMDIAGWRQYGKSIKISYAIRTLFLVTSGLEDNSSISPAGAQCLQAFLEEVKENKSIVSIKISYDILSTALAMELRRFFENNLKLRDVMIMYRGNSTVTPAQSAYLSTALRDVSLKKLYIRCFSAVFTNNGAIEQILSACGKVYYLQILGLKQNFQVTALAEYLRTGTLEEFHLGETGNYTSNFDVQMAERELLASLTQNSSIKSLLVNTLFRGDEASELFKNVLCDTTSLANVCQSNHTIEAIYNRRNIRISHVCKEYLELNKISNKTKVVQSKLMKYYFSRHVDLSSPNQSNNPMRSIANMPLCLLTEILGIDVPEKQSAVFNILKCIPELCDVSSRDEVHAERSSNSKRSSRSKRQKVTM